MPSGPLDFSKYQRPHFEEANHELTHKRAAEGDEGEMPPENFGDALDQVTKTSTGEIDSLIGEFQRLRGTLQTDSERIQRQIEEYAALSQQVMQLTKIISENVEKVRASVDRPQRGPQEKE